MVKDLVRQLEAGAAGERVIAAEQLGDLGPVAVDAIPALTRVAQAACHGSKTGGAESRRANQHLYKAAIDALVGIGPKSVPALVELLPGEKDEYYGQIAWELRAFGRDVAPAVPALAKLLADEDQDFRVKVAGILEAIGPGAEPAIPDLIDLFLNKKNKNDNRWGSGSMPPPPRVAAVRALVRIGPKAVPAIAEKVLPVLAEELKSGEAQPGGSPTEVLGVLGELGELVVPTVVAFIRKRDGRFDREDAGRALLELGTLGRRSFDGLLGDKDAEVRRAVVAALEGYLWNEHYPRYNRFDAPPLDIAPFVPALVAAMKDAEPQHRLAAAKALSSRGDKVPLYAVDAVIALFSDPAVKKLLEDKSSLYSPPSLKHFGEAGVRATIMLLDSDSLAVRKYAVQQLTYSPRRWSAAAIPRLRKFTEDPDSELAISAAYTAAWLSLDPKDAAPLVAQRFLRNRDADVRTSVADHIKWLGPLGVTYLDALIPLLDDKEDKVVQAAAGAIYYHAPKGSVAARALTERKLVQDKTYRFVVSLEPRADPAPPGVPELLRVLTEGNDEQRTKAALDLGDKGAAAKSAAPALKKLLADPDPELRFAVGNALARIENDLPALRKLLLAELERAARGRPVPWVTAEVFARLPADYPESVPLVARWIERERGGTVLMDGLLKYGPKAKDAVPALRKVLRGPVMPVHAYMGSELKPACELLGAIGPGAREALPELRESLDSGEVELALSARDAIQKITGGK